MYLFKEYAKLMLCYYNIGYKTEPKILCGSFVNTDVTSKAAFISL